jgi:hypothetical protein
VHHSARTAAGRSRARSRRHPRSCATARRGARSRRRSRRVSRRPRLARRRSAYLHPATARWIDARARSDSVLITRSRARRAATSSLKTVRIRMAGRAQWCRASGLRRPMHASARTTRHRSSRTSPRRRRGCGRSLRAGVAEYAWSRFPRDSAHVSSFPLHQTLSCHLHLFSFLFTPHERRTHALIVFRSLECHLCTIDPYMIIQTHPDHKL